MLAAAFFCHERAFQAQDAKPAKLFQQFASAELKSQVDFANCPVSSLCHSKRISGPVFFTLSKYEGATNKVPRSETSLDMSVSDAHADYPIIARQSPRY
jgi:hypothetical protein